MARIRRSGRANRIHPQLLAKLSEKVSIHALGATPRGWPKRHPEPVVQLLEVLQEPVVDLADPADHGHVAVAFADLSFRAGELAASH
jgi:hypothetical protein